MINYNGFNNTISQPIKKDLNIRLSKQPSTSSILNINQISSNLKDITEKVNKKENDLRLLNDKITKLIQDSQKVDDDCKKYDNLIEKEESEAERLRHFLNYILNNS